jgi:hypothetical protein
VAGIRHTKNINTLRRIIIFQLLKFHRGKFSTIMAADVLKFLSILKIDLPNMNGIAEFGFAEE